MVGDWVWYEGAFGARVWVSGVDLSEYEMRRQGISFERESDMPVLYDGVQVGTRRVDFFVEGVVLVELKALSAPLDRLHVVQVRNYLEVFGLDVGLLLNFGRESLEVKRLRNRRGVV